jgi:putative tricarboxylic transport membrane protein
MADAVDLGPAASIALLIPITFRLSAVQAIIMLGGIYYGAMYGGSTTSILINVPGEAASVVTCLDGYQMARKGRAGPALGIAAFGSFIAGTAGTLLIMLLAPPLSAFALQFGPPEFVGLVFLGLTMVTYLSSGSMMKSLLMAVVGSMYVGNGMLLLLNLPLIWIWVNFLEIPYSILFPFILLFCLIGVYTVGNSVTDI